jgi:hypothetical protein
MFIKSAIPAPFRKANCSLMTGDDRFASTSKVFLPVCRAATNAKLAAMVLTPAPELQLVIPNVLMGAPCPCSI